MKIKAKIQGGLAIDPRTNVYFDEHEILEIGSKGLSLENLERLVEIDAAEKISAEAEAEAEELGVGEAEPEPEYMSFTKKSDLEQYAKETYSIDLDKRLTLKGMIEQLESELGGEL